MLLVYDFSVVLVFKRIFTVLLFNLFYNLADKLVFNRTFAKYVVGSNTSLTAVEIFAEDDTLCGKLYVCTFIYNARTSTGVISPLLMIPLSVTISTLAAFSF